jgi:membrane protein DedA with SNARE-associated domain
VDGAERAAARSHRVMRSNATFDIARNSSHGDRSADILRQPMSPFAHAWIQELIEAYGLWILFTAVLLECMGIPLPGEMALVTAALYAGSAHRFSLTSVLIVAASAAIVGDNLGYLAGRFIGLRLIVKYGSYLGLSEPRLKVGQYLFMRHGGKIVFLGRFTAVLRTYSALLAGINRMGWYYFLVMNALGGICWALTFGVSAYVFGEQITGLADVTRILLLAGAIGLAIAGLVFFQHRQNELVQRAEAAFPGPIITTQFPNAEHS